MIDEKDAIQIMKNEQPHCGKKITYPSEDVYVAYNMAIDSLKFTSRQGEWLHLTLIPDDITGHMHGECSYCHKVRIIDKFCPNCGTKMRLE